MPIEMNLPKLFLRRAPAMFALCAGFFLIPAGRAQPAPQITDSRYLFIFDTSAEMKKRWPAVRAEVNGLMSTGMGGQLRMGDSLGVWAFDRELRTGQLPLQHWRPEDAVTIASNINQFVGKQHYANGTRFNALQPQLNQVIRNSARLTVLVFCDGADEIKWTPYDDGINQVFQQRLAEQKRTRQPFVLVFRMQLGQYAGSTMNFPPGMVSVPEFPPLPAPPAPVKAPPPAPVVKPPPIGSPLIIIGTKVETNWPPPAPAMLTNPAPVTPIKAAPLIPTNIVPAAPTNPVTPPLPTNPAPVIQAVAAPAPPANAATPTNSPPVSPVKLVSIPPSNPMTTTNPVAVLPENSGPNHKSALVIGGALLVAAGALVVLAVFRSRRSDRSSLISRAMRKD
jgi:hypothetical protein